MSTDDVDGSSLRSIQITSNEREFAAARLHGNLNREVFPAQLYARETGVDRSIGTHRAGD